MDKAPEPPDRATSRFIPLTRQAVIADLCSDPGGREGADKSFAALALRLQRHRNHDYRLMADEMRRAYLPFSPDRDTLRVLAFSEEEKAEMEERLTRHTRRLLQRANYTEITTEDINRILNDVSPYSLRIEVDLSEYDEILLYAREIYEVEESTRRPERLFMKETFRVRTYRRLFVLLKLKSDEERAAELAKSQDLTEDKALKLVRRRRKQLPPGTSSDFIYMKVFKDIPEHDLQILFPLRTVQFRPFDKMKFYATAGGGTLFGVFTTTGKVLAATNPVALVGALFGFIALLARQITTFFNQRTRYMMELAQKLFFHNLANNRAALTLLLDRAEEEDVKEDLIALYFNAGERVPYSELSVRKGRIDAAILERYGAAVDFELSDAIDRLKRDGVLREDGDALIFPTIADAARHFAKLLEDDDLSDVSHICDEAPAFETMEA